jgi:hypothetical protein
MIEEKIAIYERQDRYYYGDLFQEAFTLCARHDDECAWDIIFSPYLSDIISKSKGMKNFLSVMDQLDTVTPYTSTLGDFDNDGVNELLVVLDDPLNHEYFTTMIIDQNDTVLKRTDQKIGRPYIGGSPRALDVTGDAIPEIIVYATGGRQDIQAYIFQYDSGALRLLQAFERNYLRADFIYTDLNGNRVPEIIVRGEQYGDECMACEHAHIEEVFEYDSRSSAFIHISSTLDKNDDTRSAPFNE